MTASLIRDTVKTFYLETGQNIDRFVPSSPTVPFTFRWTILYRHPLSRCNLYLITVGNILDLKSFLVKYRNIKKTSTLPPRPGGRRKWFSFHEFFKATSTTRKSPTTVTVFHTPSSQLFLSSFVLFFTIFIIASTEAYSYSPLNSRDHFHSLSAAMLFLFPSSSN